MENFESNQENNLNQSRFQLTKNLSTGIWIPKINRIKLIKSKGKFIHTMGYSSDHMINKNDEYSKNQKFTYLYPEEALYLIENSSLIVYYEINDFEIPMSIQQCYENFFFHNKDLDKDPNDTSDAIITLDDYKIYSHLVRLGYILRRVSNDLKSNKQQPIKINSNQTNDIDFTKPLISRNDHLNLDMNEIYTKLNSILPSVEIINFKVASNVSKEYRLLFDVYLSDKSFRKSKPLKEPIYCISTSLNNQITRWPNMNEFVFNNTSKTNQTRHLYAFVDNGDVLFYSFDFNLDLPFIHSK